MSNFRKRTFSLPLLIESTVQASCALPIMFTALKQPKTSRALQEQIMLAVTSVHDCRYCNWVHTGMALNHDVDLNELNQILQSNHLDHDQPTALAILYAQHFADQKRRPNKYATERLQKNFSKAEFKEIMACINVIYFANLSGNSFDAIIARIKGQKVEDGHLFAELAASLVSAPVLIGIWLKSRGFAVEFAD